MTVSSKAPSGGQRFLSHRALIGTTPRWVGERGLVEPAPAGYAAISTAQSNSIRPTPTTCGRSHTTRSIAFLSPTSVWGICRTKITSRTYSSVLRGCIRRLHPRNPYIRVDALRSRHHIRVELDGVVLAETHSPVLLFDTGLPTRYYIDRTELAFSRWRHVKPKPYVLTQQLLPRSTGPSMFGQAGAYVEDAYVR
jgi:uncharacterized protein (DUF427 family)